MQITCPSCLLRPLVMADAESLARHANDHGVSQNLRDRFPHPYTVADAESYIAHDATRPVQTSFGIVVDDQAIGSISLMLGEDIARRSAEVGYWIGRAFWGRGIAVEAVRGATHYAFDTLALARVFAVPFATTTRSARVLEKAGYVKEGVMRHSAVKEGQLLDQLLYAAYRDVHFDELKRSAVHDVAEGLRRGDFSRLAPLFGEADDPEASTGPIVAWLEAGTFTDSTETLAEALTCACWLGRVGVATRLLERGVDPAGGMGTGLNALHWAANRGQRAAVELLVSWGAPLEQRSMYGGTALGTAAWAACHEPRGDQLGVVRALLAAGADPTAVEYPTGNTALDEILAPYR